jgi:hypothetical protein
MNTSFATTVLGAGATHPGDKPGVLDFNIRDGRKPDRLVDHVVRIVLNREAEQSPRRMPTA